jgi:putative serine protease PepD
MDVTTQPPETDTQLRGPWWTYDEASPVQPPAEPPPPVEPPVVKPRPLGGSSRRTVALVLAAALVGGGTSAVVVEAMQPDATTGALPVSAIATNDAPLTAAGGKSVGTPETAAAAIAPSVVTVEVTGTQQNSSLGRFGSQSQAVSDTGSGVVLRSDGYVLTNNHVIAAAAGGGTVNVTFSNGKTMPATIVGTDATSDLAVLKVTGASGLTAAVFTNSDALKVGQAVLAVGAPLGLSNSVTQGIVSTLHRPVSTGEPGASAQSVLDAVQTDAAINPGNSGGALVDLAGRVVGINSAIATTGSSTSGTSGNIGVGFAIPSNDAKKVADQLIATGHATHSQIGISAGDTASATTGAPGLGATVQAVTAGGPAQAAGLAVGDVITKVGTRTVTDADSLIVAVRAHDPGSTVAVTFTRAGSQQTVSIRLASATS